MDWPSVLVLLMLRWPAHHLDDEAPEARLARLEIIARAVTDAAERATCQDVAPDAECFRHWPAGVKDLSLLLLTQAYWESRLARNVHEGRCRPFECDPYKDPRTGEVAHRSRSLWQLQLNTIVAEEWDSVEGTSLEATRSAAFAAAKLLGRGFRACRTVPGAISRYAGVGTCNWSGAAVRHRQFLVLKVESAKLSAGPPPAGG